MKLRELADLTGGRISGDPEVEITGVCSIEDTKEGNITFLRNEHILNEISPMIASAVIVQEEISDLKTSMLVSDNPLLTFAKALEVFHVQIHTPCGVSDRAFLGENVQVGNEVSIYPNAHISSNVELGSGVTLSQGVFVGEKVNIGEGSFIYPNVTIRNNVTIGKNVTIHSGTVIGSDGFGYVFDKDKHHKIPQVGGVVIEDDVEIGANVCIDRGTVGNTVVGPGTKIDNLAQIAHHVIIGKNCIIVAQVGISGSVEIGDGAIIAGQVGIRDHIKVGRNAIIAAQAGIIRNIPDGEIFSGSPAIPHKVSLRAQHLYAKLPEIAKRLHVIEKKLTKEEKK
jgi:UDP-3-O-[3-hydroxymyristoyl] glucosamine N-acyltransferase